MEKPYNHRRGRLVQPLTIDPLPGQVSFRVFCHASSIGGVIGNSGAVVSQLRRETCCRIHCEESARGSANGVILIVGSGSIGRRFSLGEGEECDVSCAQEAMLRVFERVWEVEAGREWGNACDGEDEEEACCGVLADTTQIGAVMGSGRKNIVRMRTESGAKIRILPPPPCGRTTEQLIKITGDTLAVKKALVAVSGCLQACPPLDGEPRPMSMPPEEPSHGTSPDPHKEFFPHHSSLLPPVSANSVSSASNAQFSSMDAGDSNLDSNGTQKKVVFRMLCSNLAAGAIIGKRGTIVRDLQYQSGASIMFSPPVNESGERVVTISALENLESRHSPAQNAVLLVLARSVKANIEKGLASGLSNGNAITVRLLVASDLVSCLNDKGGKVLSEILEVTGADVQILDEDCALDHSPDKVVQITGEYKSVQNAILQVTSRLRDNLLPEVLNEIKLRNCSEKVREADLPRVHQPTSSSLDSDQEPNLAQRMQRLSDNTAAPLPVKMQPQQTAGNGRMAAGRDFERGSATFDRSLDLERSLDFLLPHEVLNEVGGRSPYKGESETMFSGLLQSISVSLDSVQENALTREMAKLGFSDRGGYPLKSQHLENVRTRHVLANADGRGGLEVESSKKSAIVKNMSVEILVPEDIFGFIFGQDGCNLARLKEISGAKVEVRVPLPGESEGIVFISGTPDQTLVAQCLLQAFIQTNR